MTRPGKGASFPDPFCRARNQEMKRLSRAKQNYAMRLCYMTNLFEQFKSPGVPGAPDALELSNQAHAEMVRIAREQKHQLFAAFAENYAVARAHLPPGEAERFSCVAQLPELFEQKIRSYINLLVQAGKDVTSEETMKYLKTALVNYNAQGTGIVYRTMESVMRENAIGSDGGMSAPDIAFHHFFKTVPAQLVEAIAREVILEQRQQMQ